MGFYKLFTYFIKPKMKKLLVIMFVLLNHINIIGQDLELYEKKELIIKNDT